MNVSLIKLCAVFGHSKIFVTEELKENLKNIIENLISNENFGIFYFGGFGEFDTLCWQLVTELKEKYPHIKRVYYLSDPRHLRKSKRPKWLRDEDYEDFIYLDLAFDCGIKEYIIEIVR